jgi:hypothetical protein
MKTTALMTTRRTALRISLAVAAAAMGRAGAIGSLALAESNASFPPDIPSVDKVLVVYNSSSTDSVAVKDYYIANRPGFANVSILAISTVETEAITQSGFETTIRQPIVDWLLAHPQKTIYYIVLLRGIPSRGPYNNWSVAYQLSRAYRDLGIRQGPSYGTQSAGGASATYNVHYDPATYPGTTALVMHLNMGSQSATFAYIDKLKAMYNAMPAPKVAISAQAAGKANNNYYLDEAAAIFGAASNSLRADRDALVGAGIPAARVTYVPPTATVHITKASNVRGYETWGSNGRLGQDYAVDGAIIFSGDSGWYLIKTIESYNGMWDGGGYQGNFVRWFSANAFGGINYSNTPVGAVCHVEEPLLTGVNSSAYLLDWEQGFIFAEAAWDSSRTPFFMAVGDPLVTR